MKKILMVLTMCGLTACATMEAGPRAVDDPTFSCMDASYAAPEIQVLNSKVGDVRVSRQASLEQLSDRSYATEADKQALSFWVAARQKCVASGEAFRRQYAPPGYATVFSNVQSRIISTTARLYGGEITFGEFNRERTRISDDGDAQMDGVKSSHLQSIAADDQRATDALVQSMLLRAATRPVQTTCRSALGVVSCTSR